MCKECQAQTRAVMESLAYAAVQEWADEVATFLDIDFHSMDDLPNVDRSSEYRRALFLLLYAPQ